MSRAVFGNEKRYEWTQRAGSWRPLQRGPTAKETPAQLGIVHLAMYEMVDSGEFLVIVFPVCLSKIRMAMSSRAAVVQSILRLGYGLDDQRSFPVGGNDFFPSQPAAI